MPEAGSFSDKLRNLSSESRYALSQASGIDFLMRVRAPESEYIRPGTAEYLQQGKRVVIEAPVGFIGCIFLKNKSGAAADCVVFSSQPNEAPQLLQEIVENRNTDILGGIICAPATLWAGSSRRQFYEEDLHLTYTKPNLGLNDQNMQSIIIAQKVSPEQGGNIQFGYAATNNVYVASG